MNSLASTLSSTGLVGAATSMATDSRVSQEMFGNAGAAAAGGAAAAFLIFMILTIVAFAVMLLYSIYKVMPSNKGMHVVLTVLLGGIWFVPALFYHAYKGYTLRK